jgi:uncharacterized C2H2 Zn-finger protein
MQCNECGTKMRRLARRGFMQVKFYPIFGFYPWECPICRKITMERKQYQRKTSPSHDHGRDHGHRSAHAHDRGFDTLTAETRTT